MDFNILIPSIAKTLDMPVRNNEDVGRLSHRLMNFLAEHKSALAAIASYEKLTEDMTKKNTDLHNKLLVTEKIIVDLASTKKLSKIVKAKNKKIIDVHGVKIVSDIVCYGSVAKTCIAPVGKRTTN